MTGFLIVTSILLSIGALVKLTFLARGGLPGSTPLTLSVDLVRDAILASWAIFLLIVLR